jgi:hypothetical protein
MASIGYATEPSPEEGDAAFDVMDGYAVQVGQCAVGFALEEMLDAELAEFGAQAAGAFDEGDDHGVVEAIGQSAQSSRECAEGQADQAGQIASADAFLQRKFNDHMICFIKIHGAAQKPVQWTVTDASIDREFFQVGHGCFPFISNAL